MTISHLTFSVRATAVAATLLAAAVGAQANATDAAFSDITGSASFDGWNQLNRNRSGGALTEAQLVAGTTANVAGSGDAVLTRVAGTHYPAGFGLYGSGDANGNALLTFTDGTLISDLGTLVFQGIINNFGAAHTLLLSFNGGAQSLAATSVSSVLNGGISDYFRYTWDLSGIAQPITSYSLALDIGFSQMLAFQVDQVAAVPEASTGAMLAAGLGVMGFIARRRRRPAPVAKAAKAA